ncbi:MAG: hypothetical protein ABJJ03_04650, partial [Sulfitobacter sp.]
MTDSFFNSALSSVRGLVCFFRIFVFVALATLANVGVGQAQTFTVGDYDVYINDKAGFEALGTSSTAENPQNVAGTSYNGGITISSDFTLARNTFAPFSVSGNSTSVSPIASGDITGTTVLTDSSAEPALGFSIVDIFDHGSATVNHFSDVLTFSANGTPLFTLSTGTDTGSGETGPVDVIPTGGTSIGTIIIGQATSTFIGVVHNRGGDINTLEIDYDYDLIFPAGPGVGGQDLHGIDQFVTVALESEIGIGKTAGTPVRGPGGTFDVEYTLVIQNTGDFDLQNLELLDDLSTQFGSAFSPSSASDDETGIIEAPVVTLVTDAAGTAAVLPVINSGYDGTATNMFNGTSGTLGVGDVISVTFKARVDGSAGGSFQNTATAGGSNLAGIAVSDLSNNAEDPDQNPGGPGVATSVTAPTIPSLPTALPDLAPAACGETLGESYWLDGMGIGAEQNYRLGGSSATRNPDVFFGPNGIEPGYVKNANGSVTYYFDGEPSTGSYSGTDFTTFPSLNNRSVNGSAPDQTDAAEFWRMAIKLVGEPGENISLTFDNGNAHEFIHYWVEDSSGNILETSLGKPDTANGWFYGTGATASTNGTGDAVAITADRFTPVNFTIPASSTDGEAYLRILVLDPQVGWGRLGLATDYECPEPELTVSKSTGTATLNPDGTFDQA